MRALCHGQVSQDFYPRPPRGGRRHPYSKKTCLWLFLSTPSARRATCPVCGGKLGLLFLSTPSARRATAVATGTDPIPWISIHALREEGDEFGVYAWDPDRISIHALREEGDPVVLIDPDTGEISIHALREEGDARSTPPFRWPRYFYPRPPRGGRRRGEPQDIAAMYFYPRPPRGGRREWAMAQDIINKFLSTPSARRATPPGTACS